MLPALFYTLRIQIKYLFSVLPACRDGKPTNSGRVALNTSKNNFERGETDIFNMTLPNLGEVQRINIGHDNHGIGAAWHLNAVSGAGRAFACRCTAAASCHVLQGDSHHQAPRTVTKPLSPESPKQLVLLPIAALIM